MKKRNKRVKTTQIIHQKRISFLAFWQDIAAYVGDLELPMPADPKRLEDITHQLDNYFNPLKQCLIDVYRLNRCKNLHSSIQPIIVLDVLGAQSFQLKQDVVDVKDIDLLENIGVYITQKFLRTNISQTPKHDTIENAQVISLDWYKTHKANTRAK